MSKKIDRKSQTKIDYWHWPKSFNKKNLIELNKFIESNFDMYEDKDNGAENVKKTSSVKIIYYKKMKDILHTIIQTCRQVANEQFGYDLNEIYDLDGCLLNMYKSSDSAEYHWHTDGENILPHVDVKLTVLINVSTKKYEGGDFYICAGKEKHIKELNEPGNILMLKSHLLHKVTPVTKGERRTLTIFLKGPSFR